MEDRSRSRSRSPVNNKKPKIERENPKKAPYKGIRMRNEGKWVAEIRLPKNRTRTWFGTYITPVAAARAYDTAVFFLRGWSGRLNFPELLFQDQEKKKDDYGCSLQQKGGNMSIDSIRKIARQVGEGEDAIQTTLINNHASSNHNSSTTTPSLPQKPDAS